MIVVETFEQAVDCAERYELDGNAEDAKAAKEHFRSLADPTDSLEAMQQKFYALIEVAREYSASSVPAVRSSLCWAWHGIGEWQA